MKKINEAKTANSTFVRKAQKMAMDTLHGMAKKPNRHYEAVADAIERWSGKRTSANFNAAVKQVVPYAEDAVEEIEMKNTDVMFSDSQIVDIAEIVVETHAKHMNESSDCGCGDGLPDLSEDTQYQKGMKIKKSLVRGLMEQVVRKLR